jgi:hypothetical protein
MTEQYSYHAVNSFLILGCLIYLFYILVKMTIDCMYIKMFKKNRKERVKNLMFKLHKLEKQD